MGGFLPRDVSEELVETLFPSPHCHFSTVHLVPWILRSPVFDPFAVPESEHSRRHAILVVRLHPDKVTGPREDLPEVEAVEISKPTIGFRQLDKSTRSFHQLLIGFQRPFSQR